MGSRSPWVEAAPADVHEGLGHHREVAAAEKQCPKPQGEDAWAGEAEADLLGNGEVKVHSRAGEGNGEESGEAVAGEVRVELGLYPYDPMSEDCRAWVAAGKVRDACEREREETRGACGEEEEDRGAHEEGKADYDGQKDGEDVHGSDGNGGARADSNVHRVHGGNQARPCLKVARMEPYQTVPREELRLQVLRRPAGHHGRQPSFVV